MKAPLALVLSVVTALVSVAAVSYWVMHSSLAQDNQANPAALSTPTPQQVVALTSLALPDTNGVIQPLSQWKQKILVVNFWATWCPPCREEMPAFSRIAIKHAANGVQIVGISIDTLNKVREFQKLTPVSYPLLIGNFDTVQSTVLLGNTVQALPFTVIYDRGGNIHSIKLGRMSEQELERRLQELEVGRKVE